jgi:allantoin racemase
MKNREIRILVINPNTTASMTEKIRASADSVRGACTRITALNPSEGPRSIEGHFDEAMCLPGLLREVQAGEAAGYDGFVVACFDDPGIGACREIATGPVVGICEAAMHAASMIATSFSVVTTLSRSVPIIERLAMEYGMERRLRRVRAADISVLALEEEGGGARERVRDEVALAIEQDHCEAVILGCAGMADLTAWLSEETGVPVIDGVVAGVKMIEALVGAGFKTSKVGAYAAPIPK